MNKYTIRRFIASIITVPLAWGVYFLLWATLIMAGAYGTFETFQENLPYIAIVWVLGWTFGPQYLRYMERKDAERE